MEQNKELTVVEITNELTILEQQMATFKMIEARYNEFREKLYDALVIADLPFIETANGYVFTVVRETLPKTTIKMKFNEDKLREEHGEIYVKYVEKVEETSKPRKGYIRTTIKKEEE